MEMREVASHRVGLAGLLGGQQAGALGPKQPPCLFPSPTYY